ADAVVAGIGDVEAAVPVGRQAPRLTQPGGGRRTAIPGAARDPGAGYRREGSLQAHSQDAVALTIADGEMAGAVQSQTGRHGEFRRSHEGHAVPLRCHSPHQAPAAVGDVEVAGSVRSNALWE